MRRRARWALGALLGMAVVGAVPAAEYQDPQLDGVTDEQIRSNVARQPWAQLEATLAGLVARVEALDEAAKLESVACQTGYQDGWWGARPWGAQCSFKEDGPLGLIRQAIREALSDEALATLAEDVDVRESHGRLTGGMRTVTHKPEAIMNPVKHARTYMPGVIRQTYHEEDLVDDEAESRMEAADFAAHYIQDASFTRLVTHLTTRLPAALEAARTYRTENAAVAARLAGMIRALNEEAVGYGQEPPVNVQGERRFPHDLLTREASGYPGLRVEGNAEKHPSVVANIQNGYLWFEHYGVAAALGDAPEPEPETDEDEREEEREPEGGGQQIADADEATLETQGGPQEFLGVPVEDGGEDDGLGGPAPGVETTETTVDVLPPTAEQLLAERNRARAGGSSLGLAVLLNQFAATSMEGLTEQQQVSRELAADSLQRELDRLARGEDPSDAGRPRGTWDMAHDLPGGLTDDSVNIQRRDILLGNAAREGEFFAVALEQNGLGSLDTADEQYAAFFGDAEDVGELRTLLTQNVKATTRQHRGRVEGTYELLGDEDREALKPAYDAYQQAYDEYEEALRDLGRVEGYDPWNPSATKIERNAETEAQAAAAAAKLQALKEAAAAFGEAARERVGGSTS